MDQFYLRCLHKMVGIKWQNRVTNIEVLNVCGTTGIESFLLKAQLRWAGRVMRMPDSRIPKQVFCRQLTAGRHTIRRYKDGLKVNLKHYGIDCQA